MYGRTAERERAGRLLGSVVDGGSAAVALVGDPGSGRSTFLDAIAEDAEGAGVGVVRVAGVEAESELTWSGLHDACRPLRAHLGGLAQHHRAVLEGALALGPPVEADVFAVAVAALQLFASAADERPLAVLVDDFEWLDPSSREVLRFVGRRLDAEGVLLVLTVREVTPDLAGMALIELDALDDAAVASALAAWSGFAVAGPVARQVAAATSGNPLALRELAGRLSREQLVGSAPLPDPLPVGRAAEAIFSGLLESLDDVTRRAVRIVALSATGANDEIEAALRAARLSTDALAAAIEVDLLSRDAARTWFAHPLARAVAHSTASAAEARAAHAALAAAIDGDREPERRARHLAAAADGPDPDVADAVERAADAAFGRGAFGSASALYEDAERLAPARSGSLLLRSGEAALAAGAPARAAELLERSAVALGHDPVLRARCARLRALVAYDTGESRVVSRLRDEADAVAVDAPVVAVELLVDAALIAAVGTWVDEALDASAEAMRLAATLDTRSSVLARVARGAALVVSGDVAMARPMIASWTALLDADDRPDTRRVLRAVAVVLIWAEEYDQAAALLDRLQSSARQRGTAGFLANLLLSSGILAFSTGDWRRMEADLIEAAELAAATGQRRTETMALANLGLFEVHLGRSTAMDRLDEVVRVTAARPPRSVAAIVASARAGYAMLAGRPEDAIAVLQRLGERSQGNPAPMLWEADLADAQLAVGDRARALATLDAFVPRAEIAGNRRSLARAAAVRAVVAEDVERGREWFHRALELVAEPQLPFVQARIEHLWGEHLLSLNRVGEAEPVLRAALTVFDELGAAPWSARCRSLLGESLPEAEPPVLAADEQRIVAALTRGESVAEIAATAFRSPTAIERHLSSAMHKLGVHSRDQLRGDRAPDVVTPRTSVRLLGDFAVMRGEVDLTPPPGMAAKALKLIALSDGLLHVDELTELLWKDAEPGRGRARLRNVLARLRASSGDVIERRGELVSLADDVDVDAARFRSLARRALTAGATDDGRVHAVDALATYGGDLLPDSLYEPWAAVPRERMRVDRLALLDLLTDAAEADGDVAAMARLLDDAIEADPYDEHRYVRLARLHAAQGRPGAALAVEGRARRALAELGLDVSDELTDAARGRSGGPGVKR
jgi:DNA-binding SARP family transcriptional activator/tetratricopeptide (TPR) repeat protein